MTFLRKNVITWIVPNYNILGESIIFIFWYLLRKNYFLILY